MAFSEIPVGFDCNRASVQTDDEPYFNLIQCSFYASLSHS